MIKAQAAQARERLRLRVWVRSRAKGAKCVRPEKMLHCKGAPQSGSTGCFRPQTAKGKSRGEGETWQAGVAPP